MFKPGSRIGVLGGGQLGLMLVAEAHRMGYPAVVWTGGRESPAIRLADTVIDRPFNDPSALEEFVRAADFASVETENLPLDLLEAVANCIPLSPKPHVVYTCQRRDLEKEFLRSHNIPCAPFEIVLSAEELAAAMQRLGTPAILKTAAFGYDGKGQRRLKGGEDPAEVWAAFGADAAVLEGFIDFQCELSVMIVRDAKGNCLAYDPAENVHREGILDYSIIPARVPVEVAAEAKYIARRIVEGFDFVGIMGVELFLNGDGQLLVNELAPRPHNSGHHTLDLCATSQFEQQLRAVAGLPAGSTRLLAPGVMLNLLSDFWYSDGTQPDWSGLWSDGAAKLHLYGKSYAPGRRKLGHVTYLDVESRAPALDRALAAKAGWLNAAG